MRKLGVRVVSAALAACMMASVLPVGAFAAGTGNDDDAGVSAYANESDEETLADGQKIAAGGIYRMSGTYTKCIIIDTSKATNQDVTIKIAGPVTFAPEDANNTSVFRVMSVGNLTIENDDENKVSAEGYTFLSADDSRDSVPKITGNLMVKGGEYAAKNVFSLRIASDKSATLTGVKATASNLAVSNVAAGKVIISGGHYTKAVPAAERNEALFLCSAGEMELGNNVEMENEYGSVLRNAGGTVTFNGGKYTSYNSVVSTQNGANTEIVGGTFTRTALNPNGGDSSALLSWGTLTIGGTAEINGVTGANAVTNNGGTLNVNGGTIIAPNGAGITTLTDGASTTINGGEIKNCNSGISMQSGNISVTVNSVTLTDNNHGIVLRENQRININDNYSGEVSIRVFNPSEGREVTTHNTNQNLNLVSHSDGWVIVYNSAKSCYVLSQVQAKHNLTVKDATAQKNSDDDDSLVKIDSYPAEVFEKAQIFLTADPAPDGKVFDKWEITKADGSTLTDSELDEVLKITGDGKATLTMPAYDITVTAKNKDKPNEPTVTPSDDDTTGGSTGGNGGEIGGAIAAVVVGGAAAWGVYEAGTGIYRLMYMPGIILPTTRAELAMLIWEKADKPEPESDVPYDDIDEDNTDLQKAARWMVEQELMDEKDDNKFKPEGHVTKLRVCTTWNEAKEKGLID